MFGQRYKSSELDYSSWITLAHSIDATENSLDKISKNINSLKILLLTIIKKNSEVENISGFEFNSILDIISQTLKWDMQFDQSLSLNNDQFSNSQLTSELKSLMALPNISREQIFEPLRDILSEYIKLPDILDVEQTSPEIILLLVIGIATATLRDESSFDTKRNRQLRRDNACFWFAKFSVDWIYNFGDVEFLNVEDDESAGEAGSYAPSPFNPLSW